MALLYNNLLNVTIFIARVNFITTPKQNAIGRHDIIDQVK